MKTDAIKKSIEKRMAEINDTLTNKANEKAEYESRLAELQKENEGYADQLRRALATGNESLYADVKKKQFDVLSRIEFTTGRLNAMNTGELITHDQADEIIADVTSLAAEGEKNAYFKVKELFAQIVSACDEVIGIFNDANDIICDVQTELCHDDNRIRLSCLSVQEMKAGKMNVLDELKRKFGD